MAADEYGAGFATQEKLAVLSDSGTERFLSCNKFSL